MTFLIFDEENDGRRREKIFYLGVSTCRFCSRIGGGYVHTAYFVTTGGGRKRFS